MTAPAVRSPNGVTSLGGDTDPIVLTKPTGTAEGDLLIAVISVDEGVSCTPPSGWTLIQELSDNGVNSLYAYWLIAGSSEPSTYSFDPDSSDPLGAGIICITGAHQTTPIAANPTFTEGTTKNPDPAASGTVASGDYLAVAFCGMNGKSFTFTPPSGYTEQWDTGNNGGGSANECEYASVATKQLTGVTSENPGAFTGTGTVGGGWIAGMVLVAAASGATTVPGSFTANAVLKKEQSSSFSANAVIKSGSGTKTFTADAIVRRSSGTLTFTANAVLFKTILPTLTANAVIFRNSGTLTFTANAVIKRPSGTLTFVADAIVKKTSSPTFSANAVLWKSMGGTATADAVFFKNSGTKTFTAEAWIVATVTGSITANAVKKATVSVATTKADSAIKRSIPGSFAADAVLKKSASSAFTANATTKKAQAGTFAADAVIKRTILPTLSADAALKKSQSGTFTADALKSILGTGSFTAAAIIKRAQASSLATDSVIKRSQSGSLAANAVIKRSQSGTLTADAAVKRAATGSFTANAIIGWTQPSSFSANAIILAAGTASFTADAVQFATISGSFTADAVIPGGGTVTGDFSADAVINSVSRCIWTTPGDMVNISSTETLAFLMPEAAAGDMHFQIEIDTADDYPSPTVWTSHSDLIGWEYWDGGAWQPIPQAGVSNTYCGNEARYTIQSPLSEGTYYRRVRAGVI
jgi:hypothetical protein